MKVEKGFAVRTKQDEYATSFGGSFVVYPHHPADKEDGRVVVPVYLVPADEWEKVQGLLKEVLKLKEQEWIKSYYVDEDESIHVVTATNTGGTR